MAFDHRQPGLQIFVKFGLSQLRHYEGLFPRIGPQLLSEDLIKSFADEKYRQANREQARQGEQEAEDRDADIDCHFDDAEFGNPNAEAPQKHGCEERQNDPCFGL